MSKPTTVMVATHVSAEDRDRLREIAAENHRSISGELRKVIEDYLAQERRA